MTLIKTSHSSRPPVEEISGIHDPVREGIANGWKVNAAFDWPDNQTLEADVIIIGTGAGGGTAAEILSSHGLKVLMIEEGPLKSTADFRMQEASAYRDLYQENAGRISKDGSVSILQGKCVGGTTVINWTSSFRTPAQTLEHWRSEFKVENLSTTDMTPWFEKAEQRLGISPWTTTPNKNNEVLARGADQLNIDWQVIPRNVKGCWNLGYCGMGCPTNAKQSMLVTTVPSALENGAQLIYRARVEKLSISQNRVTGLELIALDDTGQPTNKHLKARAPDIIMACGGINGPALLMRSNAPDPESRLGKRTFLHPTTFSLSQFSDSVDPYYGAPQSVYSDHFQWQNVTGPVGYKLEVPPLHPGFAASLCLNHGEQHLDDLKKLPHLNSLIALLRDGFHPDSQGGIVELSDDGSPVLDYRLNDYLWNGIKRSWLSMAEIQFAAGAKAVKISHQDASWATSWEIARDQIVQLPFRSSSFICGSAHVMGGLAMGEDLSQCLVNSQGKYHYLDNLWVMDGSVFPTSVGANPQLSIYGLVTKWASEFLNHA